MTKKATTGDAPPRPAGREGLRREGLAAASAIIGCTLASTWLAGVLVDGRGIGYIGAAMLLFINGGLTGAVLMLLAAMRALDTARTTPAARTTNVDKKKVPLHRRMLAGAEALSTDYPGGVDVVGKMVPVIAALIALIGVVVAAALAR